MQKVSFSQSIKESIGFQIDKIASSISENKRFVICAYLSNQVFIMIRMKDSLFVTSYSTMANNLIGRVYSVSTKDDTLLVKKIDSLFSDIKQSHSYQVYSKEVLRSGNFFLTFVEKNQLQVFDEKIAMQNQLSKADYIVSLLNVQLVLPYNRSNSRLKEVNVENFGELLKYLKSGTVGRTLK